MSRVARLTRWLATQVRWCLREPLVLEGRMASDSVGKSKRHLRVSHHADIANLAALDGHGHDVMRCW